ncbi:MAG: 30S ribosomal protein S6 [Bacteroidia bacterium]|nr:30S ribosomal protein S6 [Bacteroidia bacterium]
MEKRYETVFILTPVLSDDQAKEAAKKFEKILTDLGAKINHKENWGLKKLAYPIQKKTTGFYHLIDFTGKGTEITELEIQFKRDERILRFLTVSLDKHAAAWADKRRGKQGEAKPAKTKKAEA